MNKRIILLIGRSGTGKTTIANILSKKYGLKSIESYTTRAPRYPGEKGHTFITSYEMDNLEDMCAYSYFDGNKYCATKQQIDDSDIYVVDLMGLLSFAYEYIDYYNGEKTPIVFYLDGDKDVLNDRMRERGDSEKQINKRIKNDDEKFDHYQDVFNEICEDIKFPWFVIDTTSEGNKNNQDDIADNIYKLSRMRHFNITNHNYDIGGLANGVKKEN